MTGRALLLVFAFAFAIPALAPPSRAAEAPPPWQASENAMHPLVGRIWNVREERFVGREELAAAIGVARLVLLGEVHDNPDHHRIQGWALGRFVAAGTRPGVAMEMISADRQDAVESHFSAHPRDAAGLGPALDWDSSGWPAWSQYASAIAPAIAAGGTLTAANLPPSLMRQVAGRGLAAIAPERRKQIGLDRPIEEPVYRALAQEMIAAHCGQLAAERARPFAVMQVVRDAVLADGLLVAARRAGGHGALVAGNGHVRRDRGVPFHLSRRGESRGVLALAPIEVAPGQNTPADYAAHYDSSRLPFDYVWFTPGARRADPCESMKRN